MPSDAENVSGAWFPILDALRSAENATPVVTVETKEEAEAVVAWKHEYGPNKARVVGTTLGHFNEIVGSEEYMNFVARSILWSVKKLDDKGEPLEGYWLGK